MAVLGPPIWINNVWSYTVWASGVWELTAGTDAGGRGGSIGSGKMGLGIESATGVYT